MRERLSGTVERVYFSSPGFSAGILTADDGARVKFRGKFQAIEGEPVSVEGSWTDHAKFGRQFSVERVVYDSPESSGGLIRYLANHSAFKGTGEVTARKIVEYAEQTAADHNVGVRLDHLIRDGLPELRERLRIPVTTLETLRAAWIQNASENAIRAFLSSFELTPHQIDMLLDRFGDGAISVLKADPYILIHHVRGYGFARVDDIARKMGIPKNHPGRLKAGILHIVHEEIDDGHTWIDVSELIRKSNDLLVLDDLDSLELIRAAGKALVDSGDLAADGSAVTIPDMLASERVVADAFARIGAFSSMRVPMEYRDDSGLNTAQSEAYHACLDHGMVAISGPAGCGKTHCVGRMAKTFRAAGHSVVLCAPTGKAAKRIEEVLRTKHGVTDIEAMTIHRLLGYDGHEFNPDRVNADVLITDESSMIPVDLMAELLRHIDLARTQVILVGDHNQLPPVGPGNILRDIITHHLIPTIVLNEVVRNAGPIERASAEILKGVIPPTCPTDPAWAVVDHFREPLHIQAYVRDLVLTHIPKHLGYDPVRDVQIITPMHRGPLGTKEINRMMQHILHGEVHGRFAVGDKVIQTSNDYTLGVMNGTIGTVEVIDNGCIYVNFDGEGLKQIEGERQANLQLAYCLTAHKSQGSEFPCVVVLCHKSHFFADRNWLYTAVTRAAKHVVVLGDAWGLRNAAKKNDVVARRTFLDLWATRAKSAPCLQEVIA